MTSLQLRFLLASIPHLRPSPDQLNGPDQPDQLNQHNLAYRSLQPLQAYQPHPELILKSIGNLLITHIATNCIDLPRWQRYRPANRGSWEWMEKANTWSHSSLHPSQCCQPCCQQRIHRHETKAKAYTRPLFLALVGVGTTIVMSQRHPI